MKKIKVAEIAEKAGVSISAVSFALNNKAGVSKTTAKKILQIARDMDYPVPDIEVENTTIQVVKIIKHGNILNYELNPFIMSYINGIEMECSKQKSRMQLSSYTYKNISEITKELKNSESDGFIIIATELEREDILLFSSITKPLCFIDANYDFMPFSFVDIDNINSVGIILQYLKSKGHINVGLISSTSPSPNFEERERAFRSGIQHYNLSHSDKHFLQITPNIGEHTEDNIKKLCNISSLPSAFFCVNDSVAYNAIQALHSLNVNIPDDVSIVGFDDISLSKICSPPLTTIRISNTQIGMRASQLLIQRIERGQQGIAERISVSGRLVERKSVKNII